MPHATVLGLADDRIAVYGMADKRQFLMDPKWGRGHITEAHIGLRAIMDRRVLIADDHGVMQRSGKPA